MSRGRRVLVVHPDVDASGGGSVVAAYTLEALRGGYEVDVLSWSPADLDALNEYYGTSLEASGLRRLSAPLFLRVAVRLLPLLSSFRYAFLLRICRKIGRGYDAVVSLHNLSDLGRRGIQYVHDPPYWARGCARPRGLELFSAGGLWAAVGGDMRPWMLVAGFSYEGMRRNLTLVNSGWTGAKIEALYGIRCVTVHPPVPGVFPEVPWGARENGFVCVGRITPSKRLEAVMSVVGEVRRRVGGVHLHVVGTVEDRGYYRRLLKLSRGLPWVSFDVDVPRGELMRLVAGHRYGIHGMVDEPFGIAVAEMVRGGCIVFVHRSGGPQEVVGGDERLLYGSGEEAVEKVLAVLGCEETQASIRSALGARGELYSAETFMREMRGIVDGFVGGGMGEGVRAG
jgi:glycosyltransferase involved in cell wall biosynthesis